MDAPQDASLLLTASRDCGTENRSDAEASRRARRRRDKTVETPTSAAQASVASGN